MPRYRIIAMVLLRSVGVTGQGEGSDVDDRDGSPDVKHGRGYCLEMICADFLAGAHLDNGNPKDPAQLDLTLLQVLARRTAARFPRKPA
jgi:hypothetical protein